MTTSQHPFRFGITMIGYPIPQMLHDWRDLARKTEELGYSSLLIPDHLPHYLAPVPALMIAAEETTTLRVGSHVFNAMSRHPAILASELATLDAFSNGRLEIGLGAGNPLPGEFEALGMTQEASGIRVRKMEETLQILQGFFSHQPFTFSGQYYSINQLTGFPPVVQRPHPPLHIAAGQERMLTLAARYADIVTLQPPFRGDPRQPDPAMSSGEVMDRQVARLRELAGERFSSIEQSMLIWDMTVTAGFSPEMSSKATMGFLAPFVGSVDQICERLSTNRERFGFSYIIVRASHMDSFAPVVARLAGK